MALYMTKIKYTGDAIEDIAESGSDNRGSGPRAD